MRCYLIQASKVTVLHTVPASIAESAILIQSIKELDQIRFPLSRLLLIWNSLPGVEPVKRFRDRPTALKRIWAAFETLPIAHSRTDSKQAKLIALLQRPSGASMHQLMSATGWQPHSVRGVLSGILKKKLGLDVSSSRSGERRIYRIAA